MKKNMLVILCLAIPFLNYAQGINDGSSPCTPAITSNEIHNILQVIVKKEKFPKDHGVIPTVIANCTGEEPKDSLFLNDLLIGTKRYLPPSIAMPGDTTPFSYIDTSTKKDVLLPADIAYINCQKQAAQKIKLNAALLGLATKTPIKYYFKFSLPYFNLAHNRVIVKYTFKCTPGKKGASSKTLLLKKNGTDWDITELGFWVHDEF